MKYILIVTCCAIFIKFLNEFGLFHGNPIAYHNLSYTLIEEKKAANNTYKIFHIRFEQTINISTKEKVKIYVHGVRSGRSAGYPIVDLYNMIRNILNPNP